MTTNADLAKQVAQLVDLESVVVRNADLDASFDPLDLPDQLTLESEYRCAHALGESLEGRRRVNVTIEFKFACRSIQQGELGDAVFSLTATFLLMYVLRRDESIDPECFVHFANLNGPYNAWPYWREFVQSAANRAGLPGVVIPLFRPPVKELKDAEQSTDSSSPAT